MEDVMVTGRMSAEKKAAGNRVLERQGMSASQAVNLMYDRLSEDQSTDFLTRHRPTRAEWIAAAKFVDSIAAKEKITTRFDDMTRGQIKLERAKARGII